MRVNHSPLLQAAIANSLAIIFYNRFFIESLLPDPDISLFFTQHQSIACTAPSSGAEGSRTPVLNVFHRKINNIKDYLVFFFLTSLVLLPIILQLIPLL